MRHASPRIHVLGWASGLFSLAEKLRADSLDHLAAALMEATESTPPKSPAAKAEHWTLSENNDWRWFERENLIDGRWKLSGITRPVHKETGERFDERRRLSR